MESSSSENETDNNKTVIKNYKDVSTFIQEGFKVFVEATKHANALPAGRDFDFHKTCASFTKTVEEGETQLLNLMNRVLRKYDIKGNIKNKPFNDKVELIIETNDILLESASNVIDKMNGLKKLPIEPEIQTVHAEVPVNGSWNRASKITVNTKNSRSTDAIKSVKLITAKNIVRPQTFFKDKIDNRNNCPWKPRIVEKPNSLKPLALYVEETEAGEVYSHPYETELEKFTPSEECLSKANENFPKPVEETPLIEVNDEESLKGLLEDLRAQKVFGVDLEHHSYRSFMGISCLMQISTEDTDYIIDTLALRDKLCILNEVFTRPSIVKVFHGAIHDIEWLQRDLSLYVVNMFDTHEASKVLGFPKLSLAYLLQHYCSISSNKQFQLADWRIRPLPEELKMYAREDTHYLIYIYHRMKNELLKKGNGSNNVLLSVFGASTQLCQRVYVKPQLTDTSHLNLYHKCSRLFDNRQMFALKELYSWRDRIAREEDESYGYVLPNHMILQIAELLPREVQGVLALCNPISPLVKGNILEIHKIILSAREAPLVKPIFEEDNRKSSAKEAIKINTNVPLHCPHDLTNQEFREDLPTLLDQCLKPNVLDINSNTVIEKDKSVWSVFNDDQSKNKIKKIKQLTFLGPFERYQLVKPFLQAEEEKAQNNTKSKNDDFDPSVEDRIASLHEHFVKVKESCTGDKKIKKKVEPAEPKSLLEMGGTKKRKRQPSPMESVVIDFNNEVESDKKADNNYYENHNSSTYDDDNKRNNFNQNNHRGKRNKGPKNKSNRKNFNNAFEGNSRKRKHEDDNTYETPEKKQKNNFQPFDYSQVDYSQFQGGGNKANKTDFKMKFKQKGKKNFGGKQNNKSFSFQSNQRRGKRGR